MGKPRKLYVPPELEDWDGEIRHHIEAQGNLLIWKVLEYRCRLMPERGEAEVKGFSKAARLRMLKMCARLDWTKAGKSLFITLTYHDEVKDISKEATGKHRSLFWRYVEKHLGRKVSALWRIEWKVRKSGKLKGEIMPHYHLIVFNVKWLDKKLVKRWWKIILQRTGYLRTEVKRLKNERQAGYYVSKYCGKDDESSLVIGVYHNIPGGRQWGMLRKHLLPVHPWRDIVIADGSLAEFAYNMALEDRPKLNEWGTPSFTLLGPLADKIAGIIFRNGVDDRIT
jgi:hypothetical protein